MLLPLCTIFALTYAQHDHGNHLSREDIYAEMRVTANKKLDQLQDLIHRYASTIAFMEKSNIDCETSDDPDCLTRWQEKYGNGYPKTWDRLVITSDVCKFLYDGDKNCEFDRKLWNQALDGREVKDLESFDLEVKQYIKSTISEQKSSRERHGDL